MPDFLAPTVATVLRMTLEHVRFLERLPEANLALAESGLGPILVGGFLGEIQACTELVKVTTVASSLAASSTGERNAGGSASTVTGRLAWLAWLVSGGRATAPAAFPNLTFYRILQLRFTFPASHSDAPGR